MSKPVLSLMLILLLDQRLNGELFTALIDLAKVVDAKNDVGKLLFKFASDEKSRLKELRTFANDLIAYNISGRHVSNLSEIEKYLSNPLNTYLFTKTFANDWKEKMKLLTDFFDNQFLNEYKTEIENNRDNLPNTDDVTGAVDALIRMQETYQLRCSDLSAGKIHTYQSMTTLTADDCFDIGYQAYLTENFVIAIKWFNEALRLYNIRIVKKGSLLNETTIIDYLAYCMGQSGLYRAALKFNTKLLEDQNVTDRERFEQNNDWYLMKIAEDKIPNDSEDPPFPNHKDGNIYSALCRNESPIKIKQHISHLKCHNNVNHPFFIIRPLKMEVIFDKPRLVMFHDIIYDKEIDHIKEIAIPKLSRATVQNPTTGVFEFANYRISKSAWLHENIDNVTKMINQRIAAITGLAIDTAEDLQVVNYGIGGHYSPHFDHAQKHMQDEFDVERGNRIATLLFYLSNVEVGGQTVFTRIGAKLLPRKGSAAFWFNLKANGEGNDLTVHAACPVLVGSKWVMNKWFHEKGQEFIRPCGLRNS